MCKGVKIRLYFLFRLWINIFSDISHIINEITENTLLAPSHAYLTYE